MSMEDDHNVLLFTCHHIIADAWSLDLFVSEFATIYQSLKKNKKPKLNTLDIQYKDYSVWQRNYLEEHKKELQSYWQQKFSDSIPVLDLPTDSIRPKVLEPAGKTYRFNTGRGSYKKLKRLADEEETTLFIILVSAFYILIHKYTRQADIVIGTPVSGRQREELESQFGLFLNTIPLRVEVDSSESVSRFIQKVKKEFIEGVSHSEYPFDKLVEDLNIKRNLNRSPLFDVLFTLQDEVEDYVLGDSLEMSYKPQVTSTSKFDLSVSVNKTRDSLEWEIEYNTLLFTDDRIKRMGTHFNAIIDSIVVDREKAISEQDYLCDDERFKLKNWISSEVGDLPETNIVSLFKHIVNKRSDDIALTVNDKSFTFEELDNASDQIAGTLQNQGIVSGDRVGLFVERTEQLLFGMFGVLKLGCAYVPLDRTYPESRINYILEHSNSSAVLSEHGEMDKNKYNVNSSIPFLNIYECDDNVVEFNQVEIDRNSLAYVIYTSGSTGVPKGVMVEHKSVINFFSSINELISPHSSDRLLATTTVVFDISVLELLWTVCNGVHTVICKNVNSISEIDELDKITLFQSTPSLLRVLGKDINMLKHLRTLLVGGEAVTKESLEHLNLNDINVHNVYGPTEATVWVSSSRIKDLNNINIGRSF